ncbi:MAG: hypothetical protein KF709_14195 [Gemmatimonadaceae bacterium]|nr:hypothetical protein [Gemmatimonadaceae bacterium]
MVRARAGKGTLGCLFSIFVVLAVGYFGLNVGRPFWNYYQYKDRMQQEARFASKRSNATIQKRLKDFADSLHLPENANKVKVRRRTGTIEIWAEYYELIELPGIVKEFYFEPRAVGTF